MHTAHIAAFWRHRLTICSNPRGYVYAAFLKMAERYEKLTAR